MTHNRLNGAALFTQAISGLTSNYAYLMTGNNGKGLTLENIANPGEKVDKNQLNYAFTTYLTNNFAKIDKDKDGIISKEDMQNYTTTMSRNGMTYDQICQLCYSSTGGSNSLLETVLNNFSKIDKNGDGRVTNQEIAAFGIEEEIEEIKDKYPKHSVKGMSIFYSTSDDDEDKTSSSKV